MPLQQGRRLAVEFPLVEGEGRAGAPDETPPPREECRPPRVGGGEEGDDVLAERVREGGEPVDFIVVVGWMEVLMVQCTIVIVMMTPQGNAAST